MIAVGRRTAGIVIAVVLCGLSGSLAAPAAQAAQWPSKAQAKRALQKRGYARVTLRCTRRSSTLTCRWQGVRRNATATRCRGSIRVTGRGRRSPRIRVTRRCALPAQPARRLPALGFNEDQSERSFVLQRRTGATIRRALVGWNVVEVTPGSWDWSTFDTAYKLMRAADIRPLFVATAPPCWANVAACASGALHFPPDALHERDWSEFVRRLAARYPAAAGIEVWNEPNFTAHWGPRVDPARFATILKLAHQAVKSVDAAMPVISGGLVPIEESGAGGMADSEFLHQMFAAGAGAHLDAVGYHPYPYHRAAGSPVAEYDLNVPLRGLGRIRPVIDGAGRPTLPVWVTEIGISTTEPPGGVPAVSETRQATDLLALLETLGARGDVPTVVIHRLIDGQHNPLTGAVGGVASFANEAVNSGFGVYHNDGRPKPAACLIARAFGGTQEC